MVKTDSTAICNSTYCKIDPTFWVTVLSGILCFYIEFQYFDWLQWPFGRSEFISCLFIFTTLYLLASIRVSVNRYYGETICGCVNWAYSFALSIFLSNVLYKMIWMPSNSYMYYFSTLLGIKMRQNFQTNCGGYGYLILDKLGCWLRHYAFFHLRFIATFYYFMLVTDFTNSTRKFKIMLINMKLALFP